MREHAGLTLVARTLAAALPRRVSICREGTAVANFAFTVDGISVLWLRAAAFGGELGGELAVAGLPTDTLPLYRGLRLPTWSGNDLIARGGMGAPWRLVGASEADVEATVEPYIEECWSHFVHAFREQWISSPAEWLDRVEYLVEHPRLSQIATQQAADQPNPIDFPDSGTPSLESIDHPERFVLAALGFGAYGSYLLPGEPASRMSRLASATTKARERLLRDHPPLVWLPLENWTPTSG